MPEITDFDGRLSRLEAVVERLEEAVEAYISTRGTNWGTVFTGIGVLLVAVFAMNQAIITPVERDVSHSRAVFDNFHESEFLPVRDAVFRTNDDRFRKVDGLRLEDKLDVLAAKVAALEATKNED